MSELTLKVNKRDTKTKGDLNLLRKTGFVPGVVYSKDTEPVNIVTKGASLNPFVFTQYTHVINLEIDENFYSKCLIKDLQFDPVTDKVSHFDLLAFTEDKPVKIAVPYTSVGTALGVRRGGKLQKHALKIRVEGFIKDIPELIEIDVNNLDAGKSISVKTLEGIPYKILEPSNMILFSISTKGVVKDSK